MSRVGCKYKPRRAKNVCVCQWCRMPFQSTRYDAKTCSAKCRKALSRFTSKDTEQIVPDVETRQMRMSGKGWSETVTVERVFHKVKS